MLLGAHEGTSGGVSTAFARAEQDGADCLQIFTRSSRSWQASPLDPEERSRFRAEARRTGLPACAHGSYLVNLAAEDEAVREKSWRTFSEELQRAGELGLLGVIFHPGSNPDTRRGIARAAAGMAEALRAAPGRTKLLIETTAGQGSCLGWRFEEVAAIRDAVPAKLRGRVAVCVDTCHLHAAGYDTTTREGYEATFAELDRVVGLRLVRAFHLNDCKKPLGCRVDRHEHIGKGSMGLAPFRFLVNDRRFAEVPGFLETELRYRENLRTLRRLISK